MRPLLLSRPGRKRSDRIAAFNETFPPPCALCARTAINVQRDFLIERNAPSLAGKRPAEATQCVFAYFSLSFNGLVVVNSRHTRTGGDRPRVESSGCFIINLFRIPGPFLIVGSRHAAARGRLCDRYQSAPVSLHAVYDKRVARAGRRRKKE